MKAFVFLLFWIFVVFPLVRTMVQDALAIDVLTMMVIVYCLIRLRWRPLPRNYGTAVVMSSAQIEKLERSIIDDGDVRRQYESMARMTMGDFLQKHDLLSVAEFHSIYMSFKYGMKWQKGCPDCNGRGGRIVTEKVCVHREEETCPKCHGRGWVEDINGDRRGCDYCGSYIMGGPGIIEKVRYQDKEYTKRCSGCGGSGVVKGVSHAFTGKALHGSAGLPQGFMEKLSYTNMFGLQKLFDKKLNIGQMSPVSIGCSLGDDVPKRILKCWHEYLEKTRGLAANIVDEHIEIYVGVSVAGLLFKCGNEEKLCWLDPATGDAYYDGEIFKREEEVRKREEERDACVRSNTKWMVFAVIVTFSLFTLSGEMFFKGGRLASLSSAIRGMLFTVGSALWGGICSNWLWVTLILCLAGMWVISLLAKKRFISVFLMSLHVGVVGLAIICLFTGHWVVGGVLSIIAVMNLWVWRD